MRRSSPHHCDGRGGQDRYLSVHAALIADNAYNASVYLLVVDGTKPYIKSSFSLNLGFLMKEGSSKSAMSP